VASHEPPYGLTGVVRQIRVRGITRVPVVEVPLPGGQLELPQNAGHVVIGTSDEQRFAIPAEFNGRDRLDAVGIIKNVPREVENSAWRYQVDLSAATESDIQ
jgi:hypothetical protein